MKVPWWQVEIGVEGREILSQVAESNSFSMGRYCKTFEDEISELLGGGAVGVSSGSDALLISLLTLGIKSGDKVLVQDRSWIAAANAIAILGAVPVFVDVEEKNPVLSLVDLKNKYDSGCKALVIVHMNGRHGNLLDIKNFCLENNLPLLEDAAQALGSKIGDKYLGTFGIIGCFSFSIAKIVGSGQGGICVSNNSEVLKKLRLMRLHGTEDTFSPEWQGIGFNFRLTDFHAGLASNQLTYLKKRVSRAEQVQARYFQNLKDLKQLEIIPVDFIHGEVGPYIEVLVDSDRISFVRHLKEQEIDARPFYPQISSAKYLAGTGETPNAAKFASHGVYLPSGPAISDAQIDHVSNVILDYYQKHFSA
jgi:dTDP-4-amino-4,6-dideoxygalactose transaminase